MSVHTCRRRRLLPSARESQNSFHPPNSVYMILDRHSCLSVRLARGHPVYWRPLSHSNECPERKHLDSRNSKQLGDLELPSLSRSPKRFQVIKNGGAAPGVLVGAERSVFICILVLLALRKITATTSRHVHYRLSFPQPGVVAQPNVSPVNAKTGLRATSYIPGGCLENFENTGFRGSRYDMRNSSSSISLV